MYKIILHYLCMENARIDELMVKIVIIHLSID